MKKFLSLLVAVCLTLCGCSQSSATATTLSSEPNYFSSVSNTQEPASPTAQPETVPETMAAAQPETAPETQDAVQPETQPQYFNPLNGEILDAPFTQRIFAISINNHHDALPHTGVNNADLYFEGFVNGSIVRGLALYTDTTGLEAIGPVRSNRFLFNDLCIHYDAIMVHAGGSWQVVDDCANRAIDNFNIDAWEVMELTSFRDQNRYQSGYAWEHCLYAIGDGLVEYAKRSNIRTEIDPNLDYNLRFADDGTPANGETAENITVTITVDEYKKDTTMVYNEALGKYVYNEYGIALTDGATGEPEAFRNVLILEGNIYYDGVFQRLRSLQGGEGWFACGGKAIPIKWGADSETSPLWLRTMDDQPLTLGRGNTYIAITQTGSQITGIGA